LERANLKAFSVVALAAALAACTSVPGVPAKLSAADLAPLEGGGWAGTLTYRDYSPPYGDVTLAVTAAARVTPEGLTLALAYPDEPQANGEAAFPLSADGLSFDEAPIIRRSDENGVLEVVTEAACEDDNRPAICTYTYQFAANVLVSEKRVDLGDGAPPLLRNAYRLTR
jgi:hypothetical protein